MLQFARENGCSPLWAFAGVETPHQGPCFGIGPHLDQPVRMRKVAARTYSEVALEERRVAAQILYPLGTADVGRAALVLLHRRRGAQPRATSPSTGSCAGLRRSCACAMPRAGAASPGAALIEAVRKQMLQVRQG